jgi:ABC-type branched-subunit amino acid transport system substrate-binding protein
MNGSGIKTSIRKLIPLLLFVRISCHAALTPAEARGKEIYFRGVSGESEIRAFLSGSGVEMPASTLACAQCHGRDGRGKTEGGATPSNIQWENLTRSRAALAADGREHPPYDEKLLKRAIALGFDSGGQPLGNVMPRYRLSQSQATDLVAYLKVLRQDLDPGLSDTAIRIGVVLPPSERFPEWAAEIKTALTAFFHEFNQRGGVFHRQIELCFCAPPESPQARAAVVERFLRGENPFALLSPFMAGAENELATVIAKAGIPTVGPMTLYPQTELSGRSTFYMNGGVGEESAELLNHLKRLHQESETRAVVIHGNEAMNRDLASALVRRSRKERIVALESVALPEESAEIHRVVAGLKKDAVGIILFLGSGLELTGFLEEAGRQNWTPDIGAPGSLVARGLTEHVPAYGGKLFVSSPPAAARGFPARSSEASRWLGNGENTKRNASLILNALAPAKVMAEGLTRSGEELSRASFVESLEKLYQFSTGLGPDVTFGPTRRVGSIDSEIIEFSSGRSSP